MSMDDRPLLVPDGSFGSLHGPKLTRVSLSLNDSDRETLKAASQRVTTYTAVGTAVGVGLGVFLAFRLRQNRLNFFKNIRAREKPTEIVFEGGRREPLPNLVELARPTRMGDAAAFTFLGLGGLFLGGEMGAVTGAWGASRVLRNSSEEQQKRIEQAFRRLRADILRKEAEWVEGSRGNEGLGW